MINANGMDLVRIVENEKIVCDSRWISIIRNETDKILESGHKFSNNYSWNRLQIERHLSFDLVVCKNEIVTWCGLFNGGRYPEGVYRIMNRLYINPKYRSRTCAYIPYARQIILPSQLSRFRSKIGSLFLSREGLGAKFFLKRWAKYNAFERDWIIPGELIHVAPANNQSSYQYIAFKNYRKDHWRPMGISLEEWHRLPH